MVSIVVGGHYGDEGKGKVVSYLALEDDPAYIGRGGVGPNAGHTVVHDGKKYGLRMITCGFVNPSSHLVIGAGVLVDIKRLFEEIEMTKIRGRISIDRRCAIIEQESAWNPWAVRYEPAFFARYVAPFCADNKISATEARARAFIVERLGRTEKLLGAEVILHIVGKREVAEKKLRGALDIGVHAAGGEHQEAAVQHARRRREAQVAVQANETIGRGHEAADDVPSQRRGKVERFAEIVNGPRGLFPAR